MIIFNLTLPSLRMMCKMLLLWQLQNFSNVLFYWIVLSLKIHCPSCKLEIIDGLDSQMFSLEYVRKVWKFVKMTNFFRQLTNFFGHMTNFYNQYFDSSLNHALIFSEHLSLMMPQNGSGEQNPKMEVFLRIIIISSISKSSYVSFRI